ncbi:unnamed protein product [Phaeothamnion confervicola]
MTYYSILSIDPSASVRDIRGACKRMISAIRGMESKSDYEKSQLIEAVTEMRTILTDPSKRATYDESIGIETVSKWDSTAAPRWLVPMGTHHHSPITPPRAHAHANGFSDTQLVPFDQWSPFSSGMMKGMFESIIPTDIQQVAKNASSIGSSSNGSFTFLEFKRTRGSDGWHESGVHQMGDLNRDNLVEKRFSRHQPF